MILKAESLAIYRGDRCLLPAFDCQLEASEILHLHAPNGAGKTSVLEVLAGLRQPRAGRLSSLDTSQLHWVGHRSGFSAELNALENLEFWCGLNGLGGRGTGRLREALAALDVDRQRFRPLRTLSAGQRRRVALARLLLDKRPLWLLDEPLAALDQAGIECVERLLAQQVQDQGSVVLSSHQPLNPQLPGLRVQALQP